MPQGERVFCFFVFLPSPPSLSGHWLVTDLSQMAFLMLKTYVSSQTVDFLQLVEGLLWIVTYSSRSALRPWELCCAEQCTEQRIASEGSVWTAQRSQLWRDAKRASFTTEWNGQLIIYLPQRFTVCYLISTWFCVPYSVTDFLVPRPSLESLVSVQYLLLKIRYEFLLTDDKNFNTGDTW